MSRKEHQETRRWFDDQGFDADAAPEPQVDNNYACFALLDDVDICSGTCKYGAECRAASKADAVHAVAILVEADAIVLGESARVDE